MRYQRFILVGILVLAVLLTTVALAQMAANKGSPGSAGYGKSMQGQGSAAPGPASIHKDGGAMSANKSMTTSQARKMHKAAQARKMHRAAQARKMHRVAQARKMHRLAQARKMHRAAQARKMHRLAHARKMHRAAQLQKMHRMAQLRRMHRMAQLRKMHRMAQLRRMHMAAHMAGVQHPRVVTVLLNRAQQRISTPVIMVNRQVMLPVRDIVEAMGGSVHWDRQSHAVIAQQAGQQIVLHPRSRWATAAGQPLAMTAPAFIAQGRTYVPLGFFREAMGASATWNALANEVAINPARGGQVASTIPVPSQPMERPLPQARPPMEQPAPAPEPSQPEMMPSPGAIPPDSAAPETESEATPAPQEGAAADDTAQGQKVYAANNCSACHSINGQGGKMGGDLSHVGTKLKAGEIRNFIVNGAKGMPPYKRISEADLNSLVSYLESLK